MLVLFLPGSKASLNATNLLGVIKHHRNRATKDGEPCTLVSFLGNAGKKGFTERPPAAPLSTALQYAEHPSTPLEAGSLIWFGGLA